MTMKPDRIIPIVRDGGHRSDARRGDGRYAGAMGAAGAEPEDPARRRLLKWMAASTALAAAGCSGPPQEAIVPYADMPEGGPGDEPVFYASAVTRGGHALPVLVETHMGRPTKIEGNPGHPMSLGSTDAWAQAAILQLWDPDRSRTIMRGEAVADWASARDALLDRLAAHDADGGAGLRVLTGHVTSPTLERQLDALAARFPAMRRHRHDPLHDAAAEEGARRALGYPAHAMYRLDRARIVVAVGTDLFVDTPGNVRHARDFARTRGDVAAAARTRPAVSGAQLPRARLYAVEAMPGLTGAVADRRWSMAPDAMGAMLRRLAHALGVPGAAPVAGQAARWEAPLAEALRRNAGAALVAAGGMLSADDHAVAWSINAHLGAVGTSVVPVPARAVAGMAALTDDMRRGRVDTLLVVDTNPAYDAPDRQRFVEALRDVPLSMHLGLYRDETARACGWHIPRSHELEAWSDALAWDGSAVIMQPMIAPLHGGRSPHTLLQLLVDGREITAHDAVRETWRAVWAGAFAERWQAALRAGYAGDGRSAAPMALSSIAAATSATVGPAVASPPETSAARDAGLIALLLPDPRTGAGAAANNAWLQELPRPLTGLTWDNAVYIGPETARAHGVDTGDVVTLAGAHGGAVDGPIHVLPGHAEGVLTLHLGYGRRHAGRIGDGVGFDAYGLQALDADDLPVRHVPVTMARTGRTHRFARVQTEFSMHGRDIVRVEDIQAAGAPPGAETRAHPGPRPHPDRHPDPHPHSGPPPRPAPQPGSGRQQEEARAGQDARQPSLYPERDYPDYAWAMTIDLDKCIGCNACTIACQAENNIPTVGAEEVRRGREMHWIRVDVYREAGRRLFQPVPCMHCEDAPCEPVCPVGATVHDSEGLNAQVYNRCVGTRFCSNNCPYKVRRFNFFQYSDESEASAAHQNPDVTVRQRGVMEKCTYCVQRISRARIRAQKEDRGLRDGEVVTACEAVCPTQAIVFGNLNEPGSRVNAARQSPRAYTLLEELNTRPRTRYLARLDDPDADLEPHDA
ncbi:hypothetical protein BAU08_14335 [Bordetella bronchialis]|uniref:4Fe-4S ferredoxin-type domain-containing protein n=2 Tax=Bordetella bronchialis TaxID=463025 RepID=A0A193FZE9_9BORD|nr:hypothetical protein BAU08_14335 [Bordetella bronchialis]